MKDLGPAHYILGMRILRDRENGIISLDQEKYVKSILERFGMTDCNGIDTPMDCNQKLTKEMGPKTKQEVFEMKDVPYMEAVGSLIHASQCARPDIAHAVGVVSRFNQNPGIPHWNAVKRIFKYLKRTSNYKIVFKQSGNEQPVGYCDSDWAGDEDNSKSTAGYIFMFAGGVVSWASKKQTVIALSTCEAEYMTLTLAAQEAIWIKELLNELFPNSTEAIKIFCDNQGAIDLSKTGKYKTRTKHIRIRYHFIRECISNGDVRISKIETENQIADYLTKVLSKQKFKRCTDQIISNV